MPTDAEFQAALAKIAALETEVAPLRARVAQPAAPDLNAIRQSLISDPHGTLTKLGFSQDQSAHVANSLAAAHLGDKAPPQLRAAAMAGPLMARTDDLTVKMDRLAGQFQAFTAEQQSARTRSEATKIAGEKNPHVARALAADPSILDEVMAAGGSPQDVAARLVRIAQAFAPATSHPASTDAGQQQAAGIQQAKATGGPAMGPAGDPPPLSDRTPSRGFTEEERVRLRDKIVAEYERGVYGTPGLPAL